jgi:hypothetical protein
MGWVKASGAKGGSEPLDGTRGMNGSADIATIQKRSGRHGTARGLIGRIGDAWNYRGRDRDSSADRAPG